MKPTIFGFADDHQLLKTFPPIFQALGGDIQHCFKMIADWMNEFFLRLNASKTKILVIKTPSLTNRICIRGTFINDKDDYFSDDNDKSEMNNKTETEYNDADLFRILRDIKIKNVNRLVIIIGI